jgi:hypothetical protein
MEERKHALSYNTLSELILNLNFFNKSQPGLNLEHVFKYTSPNNCCSKVKENPKKEKESSFHNCLFSGEGLSMP